MELWIRLAAFTAVSLARLNLHAILKHQSRDQRGRHITVVIGIEDGLLPHPTWHEPGLSITTKVKAREQLRGQL